MLVYDSGEEVVLCALKWWLCRCDTCCCFCSFFFFFHVVLRQINLWRRKAEPTHIRAHEPVIKCERRRWKKFIYISVCTTTRVHISKSAPTKTNWNNTKIKRWYAVRSHAQQCTRPSLVRAIWTEHLFAHLHSRVAGAAAASFLFLRKMQKIKLTNEMNSDTNRVCVWKWWWLVGWVRLLSPRTATISPLTLIIWYNFHFTRTDYKNKWKLLLIWIWCEQQQKSTIQILCVLKMWISF